jgi:hypothetical protein
MRGQKRSKDNIFYSNLPSRDQHSIQPSLIRIAGSTKADLSSAVQETQIVTYRAEPTR